MKNLRTFAPFLSLFLLLSVCAGSARARDLMGTISNTVTLTDESRLVTDVTCAVPLTVSGANPCITFGADNIHLKLNGHTMLDQLTVRQNQTTAALAAILCSESES